ncbi:MAG: TrmB family transcriptional regulator [Candidatus Kerfeldbacteria bacterium]
MDKQIVQILDDVGLTSSEARVYLAILELGKTNVSNVAKKTLINRRNVYDTLSTLLDKGLIFQIVGDKEGVYAGVDPDKLIELIQSKEVSLESVMTSMERDYETKKESERAVIYKGIEGFKSYMEDILETREDIYCLGAKGGWAYEGLGEFKDWFEKERIKRKIKVYNLYDSEMKKYLKGKKPMYDIFSEHKFLPEKYSTDSAMDVFGSSVVTFTGLAPEIVNDDVTLFVLVSKEVSESWKTWFKFLWDNSK